MLTAEQRRWALAFAWLELGPTDELPADRGRATQQLANLGIASADDVRAYLRAPRDGDAYEISRLVAVCAWSAAAGLLDEATAWHVIWAAADLATRTYDSWRAYGSAYDAVLAQVSDGRASVADVVAGALADPRSAWSTLPWRLMGEGLRVRVLRIRCGACGAPRQRPSTSAYVYCDHCGVLVDYDVGVAHVAAAGPAFEALRTELAPRVEAARLAGDRAAYRACQRQLFEAWVDACPTATPPRTRDPDYRARYVTWLAEAETVAAFDDEARALAAALRTATEQLVFVQVAGQPRVAAEPYRSLLACVFAYEARRDALFEPAVYALHPDGAARALQRRIGQSLFVQGWLPYLGEGDAQALIDRTGLTHDYVELPAPATQVLPCNWCAALLEVLEGARRVVCEHCGRLADVIAPGAS